MTNINNTLNVNNTSILAIMSATGGLYIDDHGHAKPQRKAQAVGKFVTGDTEYLVLLMGGTHFCLNPMELDDDKNAHLSTGSVGGVINSTRGLAAGIEKFNAENKEKQFCCGEVTEVFYFD